MTLCITQSSSREIELQDVCKEFYCRNIGLCDCGGWLAKSKVYRADCQEGLAGKSVARAYATAFFLPQGNLNSALKAFQRISQAHPDHGGESPLLKINRLWIEPYLQSNFTVISRLVFD